MARKFNWDCDKQGCFNTHKRPDLTLYDDCFPGKMGFGDIDALFLRYGRMLALEFKAEGAPITCGQDMLFKEMTTILPGSDIVVLEHRGPIIDNNIVASTPYRLGQRFERKGESFDSFHSKVREWSADVEKTKN